eukprot:459388_1
MQFVLENVCHIKDENIKRKLSAFRSALLLFLNIITDIAVISTDWNPKTVYIWLLVFFNFHGCLQLSISIYLRYDSYILSILGFCGIGQVGTLYKIWKHIGNNDQYRQWMEVCWIQTTMITIPSIALQIWSMTAFTDVTIDSYSPIKITSVLIGILSIGPTIVSLEKFINEHAQSALQTIQRNMEQQKSVTNQLMAEIAENAFMPYDEPNSSQSINNNHSIVEQRSIDTNDMNNNNNYNNMSDDESDDGFDLDSGYDDGYIRNKIDPEQEKKSRPKMDEIESQSRYDSYYKLKKPKLQIIQYSAQYYYGFVSLIPSDFVIRVISIGFIQRIIFGDSIENFHCLLWYTIILYFLLWRFTYSENYGDFCWGYHQYEKLEKGIKNMWIKLIMKILIIICYNIMPSGYVYYGDFHRELYPKILILMNNTMQLILFVVFLYVFNRHLDGHHHEKIIQYDMEDKYEDTILIMWQIVLSVSWFIYIVSLYLFYNEGTKHLEEQLETLIPAYEDEAI